MQDYEFYTPREVAKILKISYSTILRMIKNGSLPVNRLSKRIIRIYKYDIPAFARK